MKKRILLITIIISFVFVPIVRAETSEMISTQLINLLKEMIFLLTEQIKILQERIVLQQQSIGQLQSDLTDLTTTTTTTTTTIPPTTTTTTTTTTTLPRTTTTIYQRIQERWLTPACSGFFCWPALP